LRPEPTTDLSAARWIVEGVGDDGVKSLIPPVFEAYARVLHPAWDDGREIITWERVAAETGREMHRLVQFDSLRGVSRYAKVHPRFESTWGEIPDELLTALCWVLAEHTETPNLCWFCLWADEINPPPPETSVT
jgi:hypothetical protein